MLRRHWTTTSAARFIDRLWLEGLAVGELAAVADMALAVEGDRPVTGRAPTEAGWDVVVALHQPEDLQTHGALVMLADDVWISCRTERTINLFDRVMVERPEPGDSMILSAALDILKERDEMVSVAVNSAFDHAQDIAATPSVLQVQTLTAAPHGPTRCGASQAA